MSERRSRRRFLEAATGLLFGGSLLATTPLASAADAAETWPQVGYDAQNTGYAPENSGPAADVEREWTFDGAELHSSPVVGNRTLYATGPDGVFAISTTDGTKRWRKTFTELPSAPAISGETLYVGTGKRQSQYGEFYAVDATTGSERWNVSQVYEGFNTPTVHSDTVFAGTYGGNASLFAFAASDDNTRWRRRSDGAVTRPAVTASAIYHGESPATLRALSQGGGESRWHKRIMTGLSPPSVGGNSVFVGDGTYGTVYAVNRDNGDERWHSNPVPERTYAQVAGAPTIADGTLYVGVAHDGGGSIVALSSDGTPLWRYDTAGGVVSAPVIAGAVLYAGDTNGNLYALSPKTGETYWNDSLESAVTSSPVIADGQLYLVTDDGVHAFAGSPTPPTPSPSPSPSPEPQPVTKTPTSVSNSPAGHTPTRGTETTAVANASGGSNFPWLPVGATALASLTGVAAWKFRIGDTAGNSTTTGASDDAPRPESGGERVTSPTEGDSSGPDDPTCADSPADPSRDVGRSGRPPSEIGDTAARSLSYDNLQRQQLLGTGGDADVYEATVHEGSDTVSLAVKEPRFRGTLHGEVVERFRAEARTWTKIDDHAHIVSVVDYGTTPVPWIAMEYMDAGDLRTRIDAETIGLCEALWIAQTVAEAVTHAHERGVSHLDLKPANILFERSSATTWAVPKVGDWGLAQCLVEPSTGRDGATIRYASPEQITDENETGHHTDIYQLGTVFYELFVGRPPFTGPPGDVAREIADEQPTPPTEIVPELPAELDDVLLTALANAPSDRYSHLVYLRDELQEIYENSCGSAPR